MTCFVRGDRVKPIESMIATVGDFEGTIDTGGCDYDQVNVLPDGSSQMIAMPANYLMLLVPEPTPGPTPGDNEIVIPGAEYDPCEGVVCDDVCVDGNLHDQICDDGICIRGVLIESNSPTCPGYIAPAAKGRIDALSWKACHTRAGCRTDIAYWGSEVTISTVFTNIGTAPGDFKIRLTDRSNSTILGESGFESIADGAGKTIDTTFTMPSVSSLKILVELVRNV